MDSNYWTRNRISRRAALRGVGLGVAGLAGAALIGCGDEDEDTTAPAASGAATAAAAATAATAATAAAAAAQPVTSIKRGGVQKYQTGGDPPSTDPYGNLSYQTKGYAGYVYSRLMKRDTNRRNRRSCGER